MFSLNEPITLKRRLEIEIPKRNDDDENYKLNYPSE